MTGRPPRRTRFTRAELADQLVGVAEAAEILDTSGQNLTGKNTPVGMPEPVAQPRASRIWIRDELEWFAKVRGRRSTAAQAVK